MLGTGRFAVVRRGTYEFQKGKPMPAAFKIINGTTDGALSESAANAIRRELATASEIKGHPNIVSVYGCIILPEGAALMLELLPDGTLSDLLRDTSQPVAWHLVRSLLQGVATGMEALHGLPIPIVHRDLKASNVLVAKRGGQTVAKIADFGLAKFNSVSAAKTYVLVWLSQLDFKFGDLDQR